MRAATVGRDEVVRVLVGAGARLDIRTKVNMCGIRSMRISRKYLVNILKISRANIYPPSKIDALLVSFVSAMSLSYLKLFI